MCSVIYKILNIINGKFYICSTSNFEKRFKDHIYDLRLDKHFNTYLQNAWNKYREQSFKFIIIEVCPPQKEVLEEYENSWIKNLDATDRCIGYNMCFASGSRLGLKHSEESKKKMSKSHKGNQLTEEHKRNICASVSGELNGMYGKKHSKETRKKMSLSKIGVNGSLFGKRGSAHPASRDICFNGKTLSIVEWAQEIGINKATLYTRFCRGWSIKKALTTPVKKGEKR